jgi:hypothetical protein
MPLNLLYHAATQNNHYTLFLENISLCFVLQQVFLSFFFLYPTPYFTLSFLNLTVLSPEDGESIFLRNVSIYLRPTSLHAAKIQKNNTVVTVLHYSVFTKAVRNETSNWLLVG